MDKLGDEMNIHIDDIEVAIANGDTDFNLLRPHFVALVQIVRDLMISNAALEVRIGKPVIQTPSPDRCTCPGPCYFHTRMGGFEK